MQNAMTVGCGEERRRNWYVEKHELPLHYESKQSRPRVIRIHLSNDRRIAYRKAFLCALKEKAVFSHVPVRVDDRQLEIRFNQLVTRWREETKTVSSTTDRALHSAYQDIIGMGARALPLIFREMRDRGGHWFWALRHITHENPVPPQDAGNISRMKEAWLRWGRDNHYL